MAWGWGCVCMKSKSVCLFIIFLISTSTYAQIDLEFEQQVENEEILLSNIDQYEEIITKYKNKISLDEFIQDTEFNSIFLSETQIKAIEKHIANTGRIKDLLEFQTIEGLDVNTYFLLLKFIKINEELEIKNKRAIKAQTRTSYQSEIENNSVGSHWGNYQQLKFNINNVYSVGFSREFDVGENNSKNTILNKYDHHAFYLYRKTKSNELVLGNFQLFIGLGLLVGQGFNASTGNAGIQNVIQNRWNPNANQTEYNYFQGMYISKKLKKHSINIAYSSQRIDAKNTFGSHNTQTEIEQKDKVLERLMILGFEQSNRKFRNSVLIIPNIGMKQYSFSITSQILQGSICYFSEIAYHATSFAYTLGLTKLISKDAQISIANTKYGNDYKSPWASNTVQGFNVNDEQGIALNISFPFYKKWNVSLTHRINFSSIENETIIGKSIENTEILRIDKLFTKQLKLSIICLYKHENTDGNTNENKHVENNEVRIRMALKHQLTDNFQQEISFLQNQENNIQSKGIVYNTSLKIRKLKFIYSLSISEIKDGVPIYASINSVINTRNSIAFFDNGTHQNLGMQFKIKRIQFACQVHNQYNSADRIGKYAITSSIKYP